MNHATISPCGNLLMAVGDEPQVFFSERIFTKHNDKSSCGWDWNSLSEPKLRLVSPGDSCFATAFSPSGHMCAAATQTGVVTIFNTNLLLEGMDPDAAVVSILTSSRANFSSFRGAVRSMSFSPSPWDLLVFAEDQARVIVLDLRHACMSAQTLALDSYRCAVDLVMVTDHENTAEERQAEIERRYLESHDEALRARNHLAAVANTADFMEYSAERRRREQEAVNNELSGLSSDPHRLTEAERQLIDLHGQRRARASNVDPPTPTSVNYSSNSNRFLMPSVPPFNFGDSPSGNTGRSASISEYMRLRNTE